jgi:serine/threonine protein kinase
VGNPAFHELLVGRRLADRYRVDGVLGRGGMSVVYLAFDEVLEREVALKVIDLPASEGGTRSELRARFRREAAAAARIGTHPHVVQVHDFGTDAELDLDFIVMERLRGQDLKAAMQGGGVEPDRALRILLEAARGVAAGHRAGLVHRDVKTGNIFLVGEGELEGVRVLDFGIAKALDPAPADDLTRTAVTPHSPAYASPEQLRGLSVGPPSDVYQLGLMAYELLTGERAFDDLTREKLRAGDAVEIPSRGRWPDLEPRVRREVERALAIAPEDRHADAAEFAADLAAAMEQRAPAAATDETVLHDPGEVTLLDPGVRDVAPTGMALGGAEAVPAPGRTATPEGVETGGAPASGPVRSRPPRAPYLMAAAAVLVLLILALTQVGREAAREESPEEETIAEAMRAFRPLLVEASLELDPGD